jgi:hypothetical protein
VVAPDATMLVGDAVTLTTFAVVASAVKLIDAVLPVSAATPLAVTVAVPAVVDTSDTVAFPVESVVVDEADNTPRVVVQLMLIPEPIAFPYASVRVAVSVTMDAPLAVAEELLEVMALTFAVLVSAINVTEAVAPESPLTPLAVTVALPTVVADVNTMVATPLEFVTDVAPDNVPDVVVQLIVAPLPTTLPLASRMVAVKVDVVAPLADKVAELAEIAVTWAVLVSPVKVITADCPESPEADFATTVAVPAVVPEVRTIVATPAESVVDVDADKDPRVVVQLTTVPAGTIFPYRSLTVAVKLVVLVPFATRDEVPAAIVATFAVEASAVKVAEPVIPVSDADALAVSDAVPAAVETRETVAVLVPSVLVDAFARVPRLVVQCTATLSPTRFEFASLTIAVSVTIWAPLARAIDGATLKLVTFAVLESAAKVIVAVFPLSPEAPFEVTVAVPAVVGAVNTMVATPLALVADVELAKVPVLVDQLTVTPAGTVLLSAS